MKRKTVEIPFIPLKSDVWRCNTLVSTGTLLASLLEPANENRILSHYYDGIEINPCNHAMIPKFAKYIDLLASSMYGMTSKFAKYLDSPNNSLEFILLNASRLLCDRKYLLS